MQKTKNTISTLTVLVRMGFRSRFRSSLLGAIWVFVNPVISFTVQAVLFSSLLGKQIHQFDLILVTGLIPWIFFVQSIEMGLPQLVIHASLLKSTPARPSLFIYAQFLEGFFIFFALFLVALVIFIFQRKLHPLNAAGVLIGFIPLIGFTVSFVKVVASLQVRLRDTRFLTQFLIQIGYFLTPIFYSIDLLSPSLQQVVNLNPMTHFLSPMRAAVELGSSTVYAQKLALATGMAVTFHFIANDLWRREQKKMCRYA